MKFLVDKNANDDLPTGRKLRRSLVALLDRIKRLDYLFRGAICDYRRRWFQILEWVFLNRKSLTRRIARLECTPLK